MFCPFCHADEGSISFQQKRFLVPRNDKGYWTTEIPTQKLLTDKYVAN